MCPKGPGRDRHALVPGAQTPVVQILVPVTHPEAVPLVGGPLALVAVGVQCRPALHVGAPDGPALAAARTAVAAHAAPPGTWKKNISHGSKSGTMGRTHNHLTGTYCCCCLGFLIKNNNNNKTTRSSVMSKNALHDFTEGRFLKKPVLLVHTFRKVKQAREWTIMDQLWASHDWRGWGMGALFHFVNNTKQTRPRWRQRESTGSTEWSAGEDQ